MVWRTLLLGCGNMGMLYDPPGTDERGWPQSHALAVARHPGFALAGLAESDPARRAEAQRRFPDTAVFADWDVAVDKTRPELVVVAMPSDQRLAPIEAALAAGAKHVFCEKPLALRATEAGRIAAACRKAGAGLTVNYSRRWSRGLAAARDRLMSGDLGPLQLVTGYYRGALANNGAHLLDLALWFAGDLTLEQSFASGDARAPHLVLRTGGGMQVWLHALQEKGLDLFELDVICGRGRVQLTDGGYRASMSAAETSVIGTVGYCSVCPPEELASDSDEVLGRAYEDLAHKVEQGWMETPALNAACQVSHMLDQAVRGCRSVEDL